MFLYAAPCSRGRGREKFRTAFSGGGGGDIPRDTMEVSVAAKVTVPAQQYVLTLSAKRKPSRNLKRRPEGRQRDSPLPGRAFLYDTL